jgi:hypothetical protein
MSPNRSEVHAMAVTPAGKASVEELTFPSGSLVLLAGLPGAGKSTLLDRLYDLRGDETRPVGADGVRVIDSRQSRNWWAPYLRGLSPRLRTPIVHVTHVSRIAWSMSRGHAVVAHTRGTWPHILYGFAWFGRRVGAEVHLLMIDVDPEIARAGQLARGRVVTPPLFARHVRRWRMLVTRARADGTLKPATSVTILDRTGADLLQSIRFDR